MSNYAVKMLTERQAWTRIAEAFARYEATGEQEALTEYGLCRAVFYLYHGRERNLDWGTFSSMTDKICDTLKGGGPYLYPVNRRGAGLRAMLATLFAEDSAV